MTALENQQNQIPNVEIVHSALKVALQWGKAEEALTALWEIRDSALEIAKDIHEWTLRLTELVGNHPDAFAKFCEDTFWKNTET